MQAWQDARAGTPNYSIKTNAARLKMARDLFAEVLHEKGDDTPVDQVKDLSPLLKDHAAVWKAIDAMKYTQDRGDKKKGAAIKETTRQGYHALTVFLVKGWAPMATRLPAGAHDQYKEAQVNHKVEKSDPEYKATTAKVSGDDYATIIGKVKDRYAEGSAEHDLVSIMSHVPTLRDDLGEVHLIANDESMIPPGESNYMVLHSEAHGGDPVLVLRTYKNRKSWGIAKDVITDPAVKAIVERRAAGGAKWLFSKPGNPNKKHGKMGDFMGKILEEAELKDPENPDLNKGAFNALRKAQRRQLGDDPRGYAKMKHSEPVHKDVYTVAPNAAPGKRLPGTGEHRPRAKEFAAPRAPPLEGEDEEDRVGAGQKRTEALAPRPSVSARGRMGHARGAVAGHDDDEDEIISRSMLVPIFPRPASAPAKPVTKVVDAAKIAKRAGMAKRALEMLDRHRATRAGRETRAPARFRT